MSGGARTATVGLGDVRAAAGLMLAAAAARPLVGEVGVPCPLRMLTGIPCPLCGMTTSVTATLQLRLGDALAATPAGAAAVAVALVVLLAWRAREVTLPAWLLPAGLASMWAWQLGRAALS